ncbi:hypothetical protein ZWY2020_039538 [Hordeum vulgare]|nr:hypothetical protein ZWY2020_039538 [Hordeum vulgare]
MELEFLKILQTQGEVLLLCKGGKGILLKSIGVVGANPDTVFEMVLSRDKHKRYEWDMLISDLELVETIDGYCDVVYGTYEPKYLNWWKSKKDFVFSRQWFKWTRWGI